MDESTLASLAARHGFSASAVRHLRDALQRGGGAMAQFSHPELGGMGQWSGGGMLMIGDMFNHALKARVAALCADLAALPKETALAGGAPSPASSWWGQGLEGKASAEGGQNEFRYAYFPGSHRLAVKRGDTVTIYDTTGHEFSGFGQQQPGASGFTCTGRHGAVDVTSLPVVDVRRAME